MFSPISARFKKYVPFIEHFLLVFNEDNHLFHKTKVTSVKRVYLEVSSHIGKKNSQYMIVYYSV